MKRLVLAAICLLAVVLHSPAVHAAGTTYSVVTVEKLVRPNVETLFYWTYWHDAGCGSIGVGTARIRTAPTFGRVRAAAETRVIPPGSECAGHRLPVLAVYYTWTRFGSPPARDTTFLVQIEPPAGSEAGYRVYGTASLDRGGGLFVLDPFLLNAPDLANLDLGVLLPKLSSIADAKANGIATDGASAAIAFWKTYVPAPVTFGAQAGITLLPYRKTFLSERPTAGSARLTVMPEAFVRIGHAYYAVVLVQGPVSYASAVPNRAYVTARQGELFGKAWLNLVPAPVLFVHGLWGDASSLLELNAHLSKQAPWKSRAILRRFAYDGSLRFDLLDTMKTVSSVIREIYDALDRQHVVGGRVNVVAHSMGGLVLRKFVTTDGYRTLRTRRLGSLAQVVTLDTPQLGSAMARFLLRHRNDHADHPELWALFCGDNDKISVAQCFEDNHLSLWGPVKGNPKSGAVWSLVPSNPVLTSLPRLSSNPDIRWTNVTSVVRGSDDSILRFAIEQLIRAIFVNPFNAPTPREILGGLPNDVIVTWRSQSNGSPLADTPKFLGLAHSDFKQLGLPPIANHAVVNSPRVFSYVECRLRRPAVTCTPETEPSSAEQSASESLVQIDRFTNDVPLAVSSNAEIGMPLALSAPVGPAAIKRVVVMQRNDANATKAEVVLFQVSGGTLRFEAVPKLLGQVDFRVAIYRGDGAVGLTTITRGVTAPPNQPAALLGDNPGHNIHVSLGAVRLLAPSGTFAGVNDEVPLSGQVAYRVLEGAQNVRVDGDRLFGVRAGPARIEARLGTATDTITVSVDP